MSPLSSRSSPAHRKRMPRAEREAQMLRAAGGLFAKQGYEATSMDEIAAACGVTKPMVYAYFGSKEGLYKATLAQAGRYIVQAIAEVTSERDPNVRLHKAAEAMIGFVDNHRDSWQLVLSKGGNGQPQGVQVYRHQLLRMTVSTLAKYRPRDMPKEQAKQLVTPYAHVFIGAAEAGAQWWLNTPGVALPEVRKLAKDVIDGVVAMVRARFEGLATPLAAERGPQP